MAAEGGSGRERMLARVRAGLATARPSLEAEAAAAPRAAPPHVHPAEDDLVAQFARELSRLECTPHRCADEEEALEAIAGVLERHGAREAICWDLEAVGLPGLAELLAARGVAARRVDLAGGRAEALQALEPALICISGAEAGIAESATVVVRGGAGRPRLASLLAPAYIAVLRREQIARGLGDALRGIQERHPGGALSDSSSLTFITGPSRTADIELTLTLGVHGPRDVHVILIG